AGSAGPLRGAKTQLYDGGIRSPLIVWGPKFISADNRGKSNESSVFAAFDLAPSLLRITGVPTPPNVRFDGEDLSATLVGREEQSRAVSLHWRRPPDRKNAPPALPDPQPDLAVREGKWKLLCDYDGARPELYDLLGDPAESKNLAHEHPDVVQRLKNAALAWHRSMPPDNGPALGPQSAPQKRPAAK
ncbi:MAG TPA: sulfatase-like hydrolase/transferase, partial [Pirellulaceae bacterium]|nr:sulfatase-like hydrolase/transferase [Pirellulaceae bacterium]